MKIEWHQKVPDILDKQCSAIFAVLDTVPKEHRIELLEQVIDYLRMEQAEDVR